MRETGYYWVLIARGCTDWIICEFCKIPKTNSWNTKENKYLEFEYLWDIGCDCDGNTDYEDDSYFDEIDEKQIKRDSSIQFEIDILSKYIEHPTKPGYKRKDIVDRIKELQKQLDEQ